MNRIAAIVLSCVALVSLVAGGAVRAQAMADEKVQQVQLTFDAKGYVVTPPSVVKGVPVRMSVDLQTVKGCMRTVVIDAFKVKKTVKDGDATIEFTPTRTGPIEVVCGMNMGKGLFKVVEPATR